MFWIDCGPLPEVVAHEGYTVCEVNVRNKPFPLPPAPSPRAIVSRFVLSRASTCLSTPNNAFCADKQALGFIGFTGPFHSHALTPANYTLAAQKQASTPSDFLKFRVSQYEHRT